MISEKEEKLNKWIKFLDNLGIESKDRFDESRLNKYELIE